MADLEYISKETEQKILDEFDARIILEKAPRVVKWNCWCCHNNYSSVKREMSWSFACYLWVLRQLEKETGKHFHKSTEVLRQCESRYNISPSDYPFLRTKWNCTERPDFMTPTQNRKYIGLSQTGNDFLDNKKGLKKFFYTEPVTGISRFCKSETTFKEVCTQELDDKDPKNPFFNTQP